MEPAQVSMSARRSPMRPASLAVFSIIDPECFKERAKFGWVSGFTCGSEISASVALARIRSLEWLACIRFDRCASIY